jgi:hypothetical protein
MQDTKHCQQSDSLTESFSYSNLQDKLSTTKCKAYSLSPQFASIGDPLWLEETKFDAICDIISASSKSREEYVTSQVVKEVLHDAVPVGSTEFHWLMELVRMVNPRFHKDDHFIMVDGKKVNKCNESLFCSHTT